MKNIKFSAKCSFFSLLLLLSIVNKQVLFAAARHHVIPTASGQRWRDRWRDDDEQLEPAKLNTLEKTRAFDKLQGNHQIPKNFPLVKEHEVVLVIGKMGAGKTTLTNGFTGYTLRCNRTGTIDTEEAKSPEVTAVKYAGNNPRKMAIEGVQGFENKPGAIGHDRRRASYTKMPNILFNKDKNWVFVDCPGFDDETEEQRLFIKASVQIVVRNIKKLKVILCVIEKVKLDKEITEFEQIKQHELSRLVVYLQQLLGDPFAFCAPNLLLVVNKTDSEYRVTHAQNILEAHLGYLLKIKRNYYKDAKEAKWNQHGEPLLRFLNIFLHHTTGPRQIICTPHLTDQNNFAAAIGKIGKIKGIIKSSNIKIALSSKDQAELIKVILQTGYLGPLNYAYKECNRALAYAKEKQDRADAQKLQKLANDKQKEFEKSRDFQTIRCIAYVFAVVAIIVARLQSNESTINEILGMVLLLCVMVSLDHLAGPSQKPFQQALQQAKAFEQAIKFQAPSQQAIKEAFFKTEIGKSIVGSKREEAEFYYQLALLSPKLRGYPVLQIYRKAFASKFKRF